ncbi:MAG TPA: ADP-ribosylation factor-like protein [Desulfuromonadales bacterium]|nr:ADP-ribosylation factor-like protein [Desulfuromonadales bacterium]
MALFNYAKREINAKIVYYGPGLCGKTTNIQYVHTKLNPDSRGKLLSLATQTDRTLFFDFLPVELGEIRGFKTRFHLYTVPGQVFYNATRKMVLKGVDGIVFVADSQQGMTDANLESFQNLRENLEEYGLNLDEIPYVIQCNKRDLPGVMPLEEMGRQLNTARVPLFGASALKGKGVLPTLTTICKMVLQKMQSSQGIEGGSARATRQKAATYKATRQGKKTPVHTPASSPAKVANPESSTSQEKTSEKGMLHKSVESRSEEENRSDFTLDVAGLPKFVSDHDLILPVRLKTDDEKYTLTLHIRMGLEKGRPTAEVSIEDKGK